MQSFLFYNESLQATNYERYKDIAFCLLRKGELVKDTFHAINDVKLPYKEDFSHTLSSEMRKGTRYNHSTKSIEKYWTRQYTCCFMHYVQKIITIVELTVMFRKQDDKEVTSVMKSGIKKVCFVDIRYDYCRVYPLFDDNRPNSSEIIGCRVHIQGTESFIFKNLDHANLKE